MVRQSNKENKAISPNVIPSANADGSKKQSNEERDAAREALHSGIRKFSKAAVTSPEAAMMLLSKAPKTNIKSLEPNIPTAEETYVKLATKEGRATSKEASAVQFDPFSGSDTTDDEGTIEQPVEKVVPGQHPASRIQYIDRIVEKTVPAVSPADTYLSNKRRISIKTSDGTFMLSVVDVKYSAESIVILIPAKDDSVTFIPNRGAELTVTWREEGRDRVEYVYFPGTVAELPELGVIVLALIVIDKRK